MSQRTHSELFAFVAMGSRRGLAWRLDVWLALFAASCTFDPAATGKSAQREGQAEDDSAVLPAEGRSRDAATASPDPIRMGMGEGAEAGASGPSDEPAARVDASAVRPDARSGEQETIAEPTAGSAAVDGERSDAAVVAARPDELDDAGREDDAGVDEPGGAAGASGSGGVAGDLAVAGSGVSGSGGVAGDLAVAGSGVSGSGGVAGDLAVAGSGVSGSGGVGGDLAVAGSGGATAGSSASGSAGAAVEAAAGPDRDQTLALLSIVLRVAQRDPSAQADALLTQLAAAATLDAKAIAAVLTLVNDSQDCSPLSSLCVEACGAVAARCAACDRDSDCRAVLRTTCAGTAPGCP